MVMPTESKNGSCATQVREKTRNELRTVFEKIRDGLKKYSETTVEHPRRYLNCLGPLGRNDMTTEGKMLEFTAPGKGQM